MVDQGVQSKKTFGRKIKSHDDDIATLYSLYNSSTNTSGSPRGPSVGGGISSIPESRFLPLNGGSLDGVIGYGSTAIAISGGNLKLNETAASLPQKIQKIIFVSPESGTADDLDTIEGRLYPGQEHTLVNVTGNTITIKHDNTAAEDGDERAILCPGDVDFSLIGDEAISVFFDDVAVKWKIKSAGGGSVDPLIQTYNSPTQNTEPTTTDLDASAANVFLFSTLTKDITIDITNPPASGKYELLHIIFVQDGTGHTVSWDSGLTFTNGTPNVSETANAITNVVLYTTSSGSSWTWTVASGGFIGTFLNTNLSNLSASNSAPTDLHLNSFDVDQVDRLLLDQAAGDSLAAGDTGITSDAASNLNHNVPTGASYVYKVNDGVTNSFQIGATSVLSQTIIPMEAALDDLGLLLVPWNNIFGNKLLLQPITAPVSPADGVFYLDTADDHVYVQTNGVTKDLNDIGGGGSPLTTKGDLFGYDTADARIPVGTNGQVLTADSTAGLGVKWATVSAGLNNVVEDTTPQLGGDLDAENNNIIDLDQLQITGNTGDTIRGFLSGTAGDFNINSDENGSQINLLTRDSGGSLIAKLIVDEETITANNPLVFNAIDALSNTQNGIGLNGTGVIEVNAVTRIELAIGGTGRLTMSDTAWGGQIGDNFKLFCVSSGTRAPINIEPVAGDPSTVVDGDIWYNSSTNKFRCREGGVSKDLI